MAEVAAMTGVKPIAVRMWISRGHIRRNAHGLIDAHEFLDYLKRRGDRGQHAHRRGTSPLDEPSSDV